jgi:aryl-alcohol dehydrogenase-like predicted oxidoreductase
VLIIVAKIDALQIEYSPWYTDHEENGLIDLAKELGVQIIAYSPLGKGILSGK